MVKKKVKSTKQQKRKDSWQGEDVQVETGLPPKVEGQLRCFCRLSLNKIRWEQALAPQPICIRVKWWGEDGPGALFSPDTGQQAQEVRTTARYPVRSGPKQFASYLQDMGSLVMEVLVGPSLSPIGHVEINQVGLLSPMRPVKGWYPIFSQKMDKIGDIHVELMLESLMESYDSTGSIPTTDVSMETHGTQESMFPQTRQPIPHELPPTKPEEDPFISPASHQNGVPSSFANHTQDLRKQLNYSLGDAGEHQRTAVRSGSTVAITTNGDVVTTHLTNGYPPAQMSSQVPAGSSTEKDLLSVLLERGNRLRNEMIISTVSDSTDSKEMTNSREMSVGNELARSSSQGSLLKEILKADKGSSGFIGGNQSGMEDNTVDLVFGGDLVEDIRALHNFNSPHSSISEDMNLSDPADPIHSESILQELFYKNPESETSGLSGLSADEEYVTEKVHKSKAHSTSMTSLEDPANARPASRRSSISSTTFPEPEEKSKTPVKKKKKKTSSETGLRKRTPSESSLTPKRKARSKVKKSSKKRRRSRSSSRGASGESESEVGSTPRSEISQVSFDMPPSDVDEPEEDTKHHNRKKSADCLSVERLTLLGRVHVARVVVDKLLLLGYDLNSSLSRSKQKSGVGKPPKPVSKFHNKSITYFVEYQFPVVATSRDKYTPNAMATEVMRVVSKNIKDGVVTFGHRSVFPIMFDGSVVEKWWKSALVFKLYARSPGQKVPSLVGSCGVPLKSILRSEDLHIERTLEIRESGRANSSLNSSLRSSDSLFGNLKVNVELASDNKDFASCLARAKLAEMTGKAKLVPVVPPPPPPPAPVVTKVTVSQGESCDQGQPSVQPYETSNSVPNTMLTTIPLVSSANSQISEPTSVQQRVFNPHPQPYLNGNMNGYLEQPTMTLHTLLMIPEGHNVTVQGIPSLMDVRRHGILPPVQPSSLQDGAAHRDHIVRNTYLVCRMFWCNDSVHSGVCWGTFEPEYNFVQVAPVLMTKSLLERMRNNFMIVEVWDKKTSAENDKLVGMVKLSLHQFYMSFRDQKISQSLLKSQFPVVSVDNYLPIVDPLTGSQYGQLKVLLAMGSAEQITHVQRVKQTESSPEKPSTFLERRDLKGQDTAQMTRLPVAEGSTEHLFEVVIEGVRGLSLFDNMIWGEADCFVQYHFPVQTGREKGQSSVVGMTSMRSYRTATTLCMPDPSFNDVTRHRLVLSTDVPVQRELLTACANSGGGAGGIPFEVWCRYYHPNIRDQCIAKSSLPLAKLCAMITMQKRGEPSVQSFALQLTQVSVDSNSPDSKHKVKDSGLLDVTIHYRSQTAQVDGSPGVNKNLANSQVCLSVSIQKATGLKSAAESLARSNPKMQYPSEVGVNAYVKVIMSFLMKEDARLTRTVARTFAPEYCHHMDFPCPLLWTEADSDALSLAQILETADVTLETWHQVPGSGSDLDRHVTTSDIHGRKQTDKNGDVLLGTTIIPLKTLLTHRTGINGWFSINLCSQGWEQDHHDNNSSQPHGNRGLDRVVGGLEMCIKFAHHTDREQVVHAARGVGWSPVDLDVEDEEEWMSEGEDSGPFDQLTVHIDQVSFPLHSALVAGQNQLDKSTTCYVRYKFYDRNAVVSKSVKPKILETGYIMCNCQHKHEFQVPVSSPYKWYLREEQLEVQVWVGYGRKEGGAKPQHRDKLIGTAYLDLDGLNNMRRKTLRVSGMYPLFKPGASSMGGAFVRAHVTAKPLLGPLSQKKKSDEEDSDEEVEEEEIDAEYDSNDSFHQIKFKKKEPAKSAADQTSLEPVTEELAQNFMVMISVERALHLPKVVDKTSGDEYLPNTYVSYQTAETQGPSYTHVFYNSDNPTWDHEHETKLSTQHLFHDNKSLVFKVWHKPHGSSKEPNKSMDRVIGYVSVDLTPLTSGLTQICGWYNITDFSGQCKGQMKVNIVPQEETSTFGRKEPPSSARSTSSNPHTSQAFFPATSVSSLFQESSSLPLQPFTSLLPGFDPRVHSIQDQTDQLQQQLSDHIKTFLRQQEEKMQMPSSQEEDKVPEPSIHWQPPSMTDYQMEGNPSRSLMFGSLRKQLQELDDLTNRLKNKLVVTSNVPQSSAQLLSSLASRDSNSPMSSLPLTSTKQEVELLLLTGSNEAESSQQTAADSGAFSVTQSSERYHEALDSNRSDRNDSNRSDRLLDSLRLGSSSHKFSEPEVITQNATPREGLSSLRSSPRDAQNNSDTGIHMAFATPRDDEMSTGGFNLTGKDSGYTPRECSSTDVTPRDLSVVYEVNESRASSEANSIGFFGQDSLSPKPSSANVNKNNSSSINLGPQQKDMGAILEQEDDSDNDEKFYHRYRDALDQQAHQEEDLEDSREEDDEEDSIIRPRTLNDISGKFGGIPGHSVVGNSAMYGSPREFTQSSHTMPFDVRTLQSERSHRSVERQVESASEIEEEIEEQSDEGTLEEEEINKRHGRSSFLEKDSWFSEGEHDRSGIRAHSHTVSTNAEGSYSKQNEPKKEIDMKGSLLMCQRFEGSLLQSTGADLEGDEEYEDDFESYHTSSKSSRSQSNMPCHDQSDSEVETPRSSRNRSGQSSRPNSGDSACSRTMTRSLKSSRNSSLTPRSGTVSRSHSAGSQRSRTQDVADDVDVRGEDPSCKSPHEAYTEVVHQLDVMFAHNKDAEPVGVEAGSNRHDHMTNGFLSDSEEESASVPNFFMPPQHMEESMKALKKATAQFPSAGAWEKQKDEERVKSKAEAAMEMRNKLMGQRSSTVGTKGRAPPTAEEAKRIARIFSEKFS